MPSLTVGLLTHFSFQPEICGARDPCDSLAQQPFDRTNQTIRGQRLCFESVGAFGKRHGRLPCPPGCDRQNKSPAEFGRGSQAFDEVHACLRARHIYYHQVKRRTEQLAISLFSIVRECNAKPALLKRAAREFFRRAVTKNQNLLRVGHLTQNRWL